MKLFIDTFETPVGKFSVATDEQGAIAATAFGDDDAVRERLRAACPITTARRNRAAREQMRDYFSGQRRVFSLPLAPNGTEFQQRVWAALLRIPFGMTCSYGALAALLGNPAASRAVGRANATNPICLLVPCHRVIGADGSLTGFAFGEDIKRRLIEHEAKVGT